MLSPSYPPFPSSSILNNSIFQVSDLSLSSSHSIFLLCPLFFILPIFFSFLDTFLFFTPLSSFFLPFSSYFFFFSSSFIILFILFHPFHSPSLHAFFLCLPPLHSSFIPLSSFSPYSIFFSTCFFFSFSSSSILFLSSSFSFSSILFSPPFLHPSPLLPVFILTRGPADPHLAWHLRVGDVHAGGDGVGVIDAQRVQEG